MQATEAAHRYLFTCIALLPLHKGLNLVEKTRVVDALYLVEDALRREQRVSADSQCGSSHAGGNSVQFQAS